jgi:hypothetical protein
VEPHGTSRVEYMVKVKSQFKHKVQAQSVEVSVPCPPDCRNPITKQSTVRAAPPCCAMCLPEHFAAGIAPPAKHCALCAMVCTCRRHCASAVFQCRFKFRRCTQSQDAPQRFISAPIVFSCLTSQVAHSPVMQPRLHRGRCELAPLKQTRQYDRSGAEADPVNGSTRANSKFGHRGGSRHLFF